MIEPAPTFTADPRWADIGARAPQLAATMGEYLEQISLSLRASSVDAVELALRTFATFLVAEDRRLRRLRQVQRHHIEAYKSWLAERPVGHRGKTVSRRTVRHRLGMLRSSSSG